jgi:hypothetical protein
MVLIALGALPFIIWKFRSHEMWPDISVSAYLLTACLVLTLINGYPGRGSGWYLKLVAFMVMLHIAVLSSFILGALAMVAAGIKPPTAMFFGFVTFVLVIESWVALRLIERFLTKPSSLVNKGGKP